MQIDRRLSGGLLVLMAGVLSGGACAPHVDRDGDGFFTEEGDCDDRNPAVYPGADEVCDGKDNDCDGDGAAGGVDEGLEGCGAESPTETPGVTETPTPELTPAPTPTPTPTAAPPPTSTPDFVPTPTSTPTPGPTPSAPTPGPATPTPTPKPPCVGTDADGDGYCVPEDCDDASATVHPGADEACSGKDNDCDGHLPTCWGQAKWGIWSWLRSLFEGG